MNPSVLHFVMVNVDVCTSKILSIYIVSSIGPFFLMCESILGIICQCLLGRASLTTRRYVLTKAQTSYGHDVLFICRLTNIKVPHLFMLLSNHAKGVQCISVTLRMVLNAYLIVSNFHDLFKCSWQWQITPSN